MSERIYTHPTHPSVEIPNLDLLSFLFDSEHSLALDETVLHREAADPSNNINKSQLRDLAQRIAHGLRHEYGVGANGPNTDVVTVITYGQILVPAAFFGVVAAGGVYSAASPSSTVAELRRQVEIGTSRLIICGAEHRDLAGQVAKECNLPLRNVLLLESSRSWTLKSLDGSVNAISSKPLPWQKITDAEALKKSLIAILWSSGTTGLPKGVMLSHLNLVTESYVTAFSSREWDAKQAAEGVETPASEPCTLAHLPSSHIAGLFGYLIGPMYSAATVIWMRKYTWDDLLKYLKQYPITTFYTVPSIYLRIAKSPEVTDHFKNLVGASTGAAPMDSKLQMAANAKLGDGTEAMIGQTWGLSESTGAVTAMPRGEVRDDTGSISPLLPCVELRVVDEKFVDVAPGREGELVLRSPLITNGYYNNPEATAAAFHEDWFCTGDIGVMRDGKFYVVDRKKELLKYKGLQVAPAEIENVLFTHPDIREAAVVGIPAPDDPGTDWPRAYVVPIDGGSANAEAVKAYVKERLAPYKQLRGGVVFVDEIPKNAIGKYLRRELRERARKEMGGGRTSKL